MASMRGRVWAGSIASPTAVLAAIEWWWQEGQQARGAGGGTERGGGKRRKEGAERLQREGYMEHDSTAPGAGGAQRHQAWGFERSDVSNPQFPPNGLVDGVVVEEADSDEEEGDEEGDGTAEALLLLDALVDSLTGLRWKYEPHAAGSGSEGVHPNADGDGESSRRRRTISGSTWAPTGPDDVRVCLELGMLKHSVR